MTHTLTLDLHRPPLTMNEARRAHWTKQRNAKTVAELHVKNAVKVAGLGKVGPCHIAFTWFKENARIADSDCLGFFAKSALDALVRSGVIARDDFRHVLSTTMRVDVSRDNPRIEIRITEAGE